MTLAQWLEKSPVVGKVYDKGVYTIPDQLPDDLRRELWNLSDYRVSSVTGGSIWLTKKKTTESKPKMTYELAMAAAKDEANRHMRAGGRTKWDESDYNEMARVFNELWPEGSETESIVEALLGCDL